MTEKPSTIFAEMPCLVELLGHNRIAGRVSEVSVGGSTLLRVDVPAVDGVQAFTKYFSMGAIYAITPTDEATMLVAVKGMQPKPIERYQFSLPADDRTWKLVPDDGRTIQDEIRDIESGDFDPEDFDDDDFDDFDEDEEEEEAFGDIADREYSQHKDDLDTSPREAT